VSFREGDFVRWITEGMVGRVPMGPGDDAAMLPDGTVLAMDAVTEGVHFAPGTAPELVARKALGRPLSDLCAAGALPGQVLVAALLPAGCDGEGLARAFNAQARLLSVAIIGGDTKRSASSGLAFAVTAAGRCPGGAPPWRRSGARPGDRLLVSGPLGGADLGRHLRVTPRTDVVAALRGAGVPVHAATDLSDGLSRNLALLCAAAGVGARVDAERLPIHPDVPTGRDPVTAALGDGEDYELLLALPPGVPAPDGLVEVGEVTPGPGLLLLHAGRELPWPDLGYEHAF
jgi:thiamine-monophosphate kinase